MRFRSRALAACAVAFALVAAGCGGDDDDDGGAAGTEAGGTTGGTTGAATEGTGGAATEGTGGGTSGAATACTSERADTLTVAAIGSPIGGLSAANSQFGNRNLFYQAIYDPLIRAEPDGTLTPWLATEWSYNDDNTVLTMKLRDDITFTDGTPFNADAAAQNLVRFRDGTSPDASNLALMTDAKAVDDTTLEITLSAPDPALLNYLGRNAGLMEAPSSFDASDEASNPIGSGPYVVNTGDTVTDSKYVFDANPDYWAPEMVKYDKLVIPILGDPTAMLNAIKAGEINAGTLVANDVIPDVESAGWDLHTQELDWVGMTLVDRDGSMGTPLGDVKVRQAINQAFDREALLQGLESGYGTVTTQVFREDSAGFDPALDELYPYDPDAAKQLLADAGYPDGFSLSIPTASQLPEAYFATLQDQLGAIGIDVSLNAENDYIAAILAPKYPAYFMFLEQAANDWQFTNFLLSEDAVWNPSHYTDATSAELIQKIQTTTDDEQAAATKELGKYVTEQAWFAPWYRKQSTFATDAKTDVEIQTGNAIPYLFNFCPQG